jgi:hypothetical protein
MSYTKYIEFDKNCKYLNLEKQNAYKMLNYCINPKTSNTQPMEPLQILYDSSNPMEVSLKDEGKILEPYTNNLNMIDKPDKDYVAVTTCPEGYKVNLKSGLCEEVCTHCYNNIYTKPMETSCDSGSGYFFNGIDNSGDAICSRKFDETNIKGLNLQQNYKLF